MDRKNIEYALDHIREIKGSCTFYDVHVHPFEVMDGAINYTRTANCPSLYSSVAAEYVTPEISNLDLKKKKKRVNDHHDKTILNKMLHLNRRRIYAHSGPKVFCDQMKLSGVDKVVLLPVMAKDEYGDQQLHLLSDMFGGDDRFMLGYCIPNDIPVGEIAENIKQAANEYNVEILKVHPSLQGIDPSRADGKDRIESILAAAKQEGLKVIIHGGLSPDCTDADAVGFGALSNFEHIDWSITSEAVVIAHSGAYGHSPEELSRDVLPSLNRMLSRHSNLMVDTAALEVDSLSLVFKNIPTDRICFGSDTLYEKQWIEMIKMWCALQQSVRKPEESLIKIASRNPLKLFPGENTNAREITNQIESNC